MNDHDFEPIEPLVNLIRARVFAAIWVHKLMEHWSWVTFGPEWPFSRS